MPKFWSNLSILYGEHDFLDRFDAMAADGFESAEFLFPYAFPVRTIAARLKRSKVVQVLHNLPVGNLRLAARILGKISVRLLIEPANEHDIPDFWLQHVEDAAVLIEEAGSDNLFILYDIFHQSRTARKLIGTFHRFRDRRSQHECRLHRTWNHGTADGCLRRGRRTYAALPFAGRGAEGAGRRWSQDLREPVELTLSNIRHLDIHFPNTTSFQSLFNACTAAGRRDWDHSALIRALERIAANEQGRQISPCIRSTRHKQEIEQYGQHNAHGRRYPLLVHRSWCKHHDAAGSTFPPFQRD